MEGAVCRQGRWRGAIRCSQARTAGEYSSSSFSSSFRPCGSEVDIAAGGSGSLYASGVPLATGDVVDGRSVQRKKQTGAAPGHSFSCRQPAAFEGRATQFEMCPLLASTQQ